MHVSEKRQFLFFEKYLGIVSEQEFVKNKDILSSPLVVKPFDPNLSIYFIMNASHLHGLGFALLQLEANNKLCLIHCGSKSLNDTQLNYATIKLECLAI